MITPDEVSPPGPSGTVGRRRRRRWRVASVAAFAVAGGLFVTSSLDADGQDLRASSVTDLDSVVRQQRNRTDDLQAQVATLNQEIDDLSAGVKDGDVAELQSQVDALRGPAGLEPVRGKGVLVVLEDAPGDVVDAAAQDPDVPLDTFVVHQQDIQAVANALWAGGAEAMTLQGQRVVATTGIKCVGNTVVLHGVPYSPPYRIAAIGQPAALLRSLGADDYVQGYARDARRYQLGYRLAARERLDFPAYDGTTDLVHAAAGRAEDTTTRGGAAN